MGIGSGEGSLIGSGSGLSAAISSTGGISSIQGIGLLFLKEISSSLIRSSRAKRRVKSSFLSSRISVKRRHYKRDVH